MINGIEGDEYGFTETHSDAGYSLLKKEVIVKVKETKADITPTEANITGIQSKSDADSTANDGVPNGSVLKNDVTVQTTAASATVDETKATMTKHDDSGNAYQYADHKSEAVHAANDRWGRKLSSEHCRGCCCWMWDLDLEQKQRTITKIK